MVTFFHVLEKCPSFSGFALLLLSYHLPDDASTLSMGYLFPFLDEALWSTKISSSGNDVQLVLVSGCYCFGVSPCYSRITHLLPSVLFLLVLGLCC